MKRSLVLLLVLALTLPLAAPPPAAGQFAVIDVANLVEQIRQYAQMLAEYWQQYEILVKQVEQLARLVEQVEMMELNLRQLERFGADNPERFLFSLRSLFAQLEGIVYSADDVLRSYDEIYRPGVAVHLPTDEADRTTETLETFRSLLAGAHENARLSDDAASALSGLTGQLATAEGNLEALQAVGALTTQVATETTRLSELHAMTLNALTVHYSHELASREEARLTFLDWIHRGRFHFDDSPQSFDLVPNANRSGR
jgi:P-type conjugative transfer protein TrbJ